MNPGPKRLALLDAQALPELIELIVRDLSFHLHVIRAPVSPARLTQPRLQGAMGRQNQQTLAVRVQASGGVNTRDRNQFGEGGPAAVALWGELTENAVGLVEQDRLQGLLGRRRAQAFRIGTDRYQVFFPA